MNLLIQTSRSPSPLPVMVANIYYIKHLNARINVLFCQDHLPENKKCPECGEEVFKFDEKKTENINNKYQVKCLNCPSKMILKEFDSHLKEGCKKECPQKCDRFFSTEHQIEKHIKEECINTETKCIACSLTDKRGLILMHQEICEEFEKINRFVSPLQNKIVILERHNQMQEEETKKQAQEIIDMRQLIEKQAQEFNDMRQLIEKQVQEINDMRQLIEK